MLAVREETRPFTNLNGSGAIQGVWRVSQASIAGSWESR
jgi:hypothetical protein